MLSWETCTFFCCWYWCLLRLTFFFHNLVSLCLNRQPLSALLFLSEPLLLADISVYLQVAEWAPTCLSVSRWSLYGRGQRALRCDCHSQGCSLVRPTHGEPRAEWLAEPHPRGSSVHFSKGRNRGKYLDNSSQHSWYLLFIWFYYFTLLYVKSHFLKYLWRNDVKTFKISPEFHMKRFLWPLQIVRKSKTIFKTVLKVSSRQHESNCVGINYSYFKPAIPRSLVFSL